MLFFAAIGMAGFIGLLILWLWVLPDRAAGRWPAVALGLTLGGLAGVIASQYGIAVASGVAGVVGVGAGWLYYRRVTI